MGKIISVIIPFYKETEQELFRVLSSIRNQLGVDFKKIECILVNDGANNIPRAEFLDMFLPLECRCIPLAENKGPGVARQAGIDAAQGEYIMFCDADDMLHNCAVLNVFSGEAKMGADMLTADFYEEDWHEETGEYSYMRHSHDKPWLFAKLFRRQYLIDNDIRFHPDLRQNEETYFLTVAAAQTDSIITLKYIAYVWCYNEKSITRRNNRENRYKSFGTYIDAAGKCFETLKKKAPNTMILNVVKHIIFVYFQLHRPYWKHHPAAAYLEPAETAFGTMISAYINYYNTAEKSVVDGIYSDMQAALVMEEAPKESLDAWLSRVVPSYKKPITLISIIIPYYKKTERQILPLLASISRQIGADFSRVECILVIDAANNKQRQGFLDMFKPLELKLIPLDKNEGPGDARQAGIDAARGEYLLFCDAYDMLYSCDVLSTFMNETAKGADIVSAQWLEEHKNPKDGYVLHSSESAGIHGKLIKRQFLIDNDIRFSPDLRMNEDGFFLSAASAVAREAVLVPAITYVRRGLSRLKAGQLVSNAGKQLSIIIPYFEEKEEVLLPLLSSVSSQIGVDFSQIECILVNDGANNHIEPEFLSLFAPLAFRCIYLPENRGPGYARQAGIDAACGNYLLFCDADDILYDCSVLNTFMNQIPKEPDIVVSNWLEEVFDPNAHTYFYVLHGQEATWMHGKLIQRRYLQNNGIRFHPELRLHEDSYFLTIAYALTKKHIFLPATTYVWRYRENSITSSGDVDYNYATYVDFISAVGKAFTVIAEQAPEVMRFRVVQFIIYTYFMIQRAYLQPSVTRFNEPIEQAFRAVITPYLEYYTQSDPAFIEDIASRERSREFCEEASETLDVWLNRVMTS